MESLGWMPLWWKSIQITLRLGCLNRVKPGELNGNSATKTTWRVKIQDLEWFRQVKLRWVGECCAGFGIFWFVDLLKIAFRDRYLRFLESHSPRVHKAIWGIPSLVHSLVWHFQGKIKDFYVGRGVEPAYYVLRSQFTVNEFIPLLHAKLSHVFPVWSKHWTMSSENRDFLWLNGPQIRQKRSCLGMVRKG